MMSSTKPEVEKDQAGTIVSNVHKSLVKFGRVAFELCEQTDRQTDKPTYSLQYFAKRNVND